MNDYTIYTTAKQRYADLADDVARSRTPVANRGRWSRAVTSTRQWFAVLANAAN